MAETMFKMTFFLAYLLLLIPLAFLGKKANEKKTSKEFYLAGGNLGLIVLFFTLFATQYSGNTFLAFPGKTYRMGYAYIMSVTFMMAIIPAYLLYAPALRRIAQQKAFLTPADWIHERYQSKGLTLCIALIMAFALMNFLLAQLMAMGHAVSGLSDGKIPYAAGVIGLALIIVVYESMGGMRTVAWTDVIQGLIMFLAVLVLGGYLLTQKDLFDQAAREISVSQPEKIEVPTLTTCMTWLSAIVLVGIGGAMYPQGIQRIYASKSTLVLKRSLILMVFIPLITVLFAYAMGILSMANFPGLSKIESDGVMPRMLALLAGDSILLSLGASLLMVGAVAAMMSTADSVLLSLSSIFAHDFYSRLSNKNPSDEKTLRVGKTISWVLMCILVAIAVRPGFTLWRLMEIKFELLIQVAPAFIFGFYLKKLDAKIAFFALMVGCVIALSDMLFGVPKIAGLHFGTIGFLVNLGICFGVSSVRKKS